MAKVTSSSSRSKRKTKKPVSTDKGRPARARVSTAQTTSSEARNPNRVRAGINQGTRAGVGRVTGTTGRRKPATPAKVTTSRGGERGSGSSPSTQSADAKRFKELNQSKSARDGKAQEIRQRRTAARAAKPAPGTGNVVKTAIERGQKAKETQRNQKRVVAGLRSAANQATGAKAAIAALSGPRGLAVKAIADTVAPRPTAKGTLSAGGVQGPVMPKRLKEQGYAAQEKKARQSLAARKKATGSKEATPKTAASFDDAFKDARRAKVKTFTWRGKKYTTEMK